MTEVPAFLTDADEIVVFPPGFSGACVLTLGTEWRVKWVTVAVASVIAERLQAPAPTPLTQEPDTGESPMPEPAGLLRRLGLARADQTSPAAGEGAVAGGETP